MPFFISIAVLTFGFQVHATSIPRGISLKTQVTLCEAVLGVNKNAQRHLALNGAAVIEIINRLYYQIKLIGKDKDVYSNKLYSTSVQTYLRNLEGFLLSDKSLDPHTIKELKSVFSSLYRVKKVLSEKPEYRGVVKNRKELNAIAEQYGVVQTDRFLSMTESDQVELLNDTIQELKKIPLSALRAIEFAGSKIDLVTTSVTSHADMDHLKGVTPRGWPEGRTWDHVPGLSDHKGTIVAVDQLKENHGSVNLILHEHAHTYDSSMVERSNGIELSQTSDFLEAHQKTKWKKIEDDYEFFYPEEAFAECLALYLDSDKSREKLKEERLPMYDYFEKHFGVKR